MLKIQDLNHLFPFGFSVDSRCRITFLGSSLQKLVPKAKVGMNAGELFSIMKPSSSDWKFSSLKKQQNDLFLIEAFTGKRKIILRGQLLTNEDGMQWLVSPWLTNPDELENLDLQMNDFAIHDPVNDLLQIVQSHNLATKDLEAAAENILLKSKELQRSESHLKTLIENMSSGILVEDKNAVVTHANQVFADIFAGGIDAHLLTGTNCRDSAEQVKQLFKDPELFLKRIGILMEKGAEVKGEEIELHDGRIFERDFIPLIQDSMITGYLWSYRDISKIKEAEKKAIEASEEKSRFLATMSHEIRTPLNGVIGMSSLLLETPLNRDQKEIVTSISSSGETLLTIVNDILDFSKIEAGKWELEKIEFDLTSYCREALKVFSYTAEKKNIKLQEDIASLNYHVVGDDGRFGQILSNLVSNAIKFTKKGKVSVLLRANESPRETRILLEVKDTGIGIPKEAKERMFQAFTQANHSSARHFGGTGLGLSISKKLVEMMKGSIRFESEVGKGTTFFVEIPFARGEKIREKDKYRPKEDAAGSFPKELAGARILVAEDNLTNQKVIGRMLSRIGLKAHLVANGNEVLDSLRNGQYDLILMDCQMPDLDGYQTTEAIRTSDTLPRQIPIVALTANAIKGDEQRCLECGMNAYLVKPIKLNDLAACLEDQLMKQPKSYIHKDSLKQFDELQIEGEPNILVETIDSFLKTSSERVKSMLDSASEKNLEKVSRDAHCLKSSAHMLGARQLVNICLALEEIGETKNQGSLAELIKELKAVHSASCEELKSIRDRECKKTDRKAA